MIRQQWDGIFADMDAAEAALAGAERELRRMTRALLRAKREMAVLRLAALAPPEEREKGGPDE